MLVIYCTLTNTWVSGTDYGVVFASANPAKAMLFSSEDKAQKVIRKLHEVWVPHMQIMDHTKSTQLHKREVTPALPPRPRLISHNAF